MSPRRSGKAFVSAVLFFGTFANDAAYVVFPGNVGTNETLRDLVASWAKQ